MTQPVEGPTHAGELEFSVVVPVRDEAANVEPLIAEIHAAMKDQGAFEVVYVDDGSEDETPERLMRARERFPNLRVVRHRRNCGQSAAIWTGVNVAHGRWIITLDGDGQNDPADIPKLLEAWRRPDLGADVRLIAGVRQKRQDSWVKRVSSRIANAVRTSLLHDDLVDTGCGLKLVHRESFLQLPYFDHMHRFLAALCHRSGYRVVPVAVSHRPRRHGRSKYGTLNRLFVGIVDLFGVMWLQRRASRPVVETWD